MVTKHVRALTIEDRHELREATFDCRHTSVAAGSVRAGTWGRLQEKLSPGPVLPHGSVDWGRSLPLRGWAAHLGLVRSSTCHGSKLMRAGFRTSKGDFILLVGDSASKISASLCWCRGCKIGHAHSKAETASESVSSRDTFSDPLVRPLLIPSQPPGFPRTMRWTSGEIRARPATSDMAILTSVCKV